MAFRNPPYTDTPVTVGGVEFASDLAILARQLARGRTFKFDAGEAIAVHPRQIEIKPLRNLVEMGYAATEPLPDDKTVRFVATRALLDLARIDADRRISFDLFADLAGIDLSPARCRKYLKSGYGEPNPGRKPPRVFPTAKGVALKVDDLKRQGKQLTENDPIEEGDVYQVSSPELTRWYVQRYQALNAKTAHCLVQYPANP